MPTLPPSLATRDRGDDVAHDLLVIDLVHDRDAALSRWRVVADVELGLDMLEDAGRDGEIAFGREPSVTDRMCELTRKSPGSRPFRPRLSRRDRRPGSIGPAPSGFSSIQAMSISLGLSGVYVERGRASCAMAMPPTTTEREHLIEGEGLAQDDNRHDRAEHRHQIDEHAGPAGPISSTPRMNVSCAMKAGPSATKASTRRPPRRAREIRRT